MEMTKNEVKDLLKKYNYVDNVRVKLSDWCFLSTDDKLKRTYYDAFISMDGILREYYNKLHAYAKSSPVGNWLLSIKGIDSRLASVLIAYLDVTNLNYAAQVIRYCGLHNDGHSNPNIACNLDIISRSFLEQKEEESLYKRLYTSKYKELSKNDIEETTVHIRANRYMLKVFISHIFEEMYREIHDGKAPPRHKDDEAVIIEPEVPYTK